MNPMEKWRESRGRALAVPPLHIFTPDEVRRAMGGERVRYEERGPNSPEHNAVGWLTALKVEQWCEGLVKYGPSGKPGTLTTPLPEQDWGRLADQVNLGRFTAR